MSYNDAAYLIDLRSKPQRISQEKYRHPEDARFIRPKNKLNTSGIVTCVAFSPDGKTLAVGDDGPQGAPSFWSVETGKQVNHVTSSSATTHTFLQWSPNGKLLAATGQAGITMYDIEAQNSWETAWKMTDSVTSTAAGYMGGITPIAWSPDGKMIFTGGDEVRRWRASDLKLEYSYGVAGPVAVSPDGKTLATASRADDPVVPKGILLWKLG